MELRHLALLTWANVDLQHNRLSLVTRKTRTPIVLPLTGGLKEHLLSLPTSDDLSTPLHERAYRIVTGQHGRTGSLSNQFAQLLTHAGLREPTTHEVTTGKGRGGPRNGGELSFHSLRHSAVSLLKAAGIPHSTVQALIGHESAAISQHYTHTDQEVIGQATEKLAL